MTHKASIPVFHGPIKSLPPPPKKKFVCILWKHPIHHQDLKKYFSPKKGLNFCQKRKKMFWTNTKLHPKCRACSHKRGQSWYFPLNVAPPLPLPLPPKFSYFISSDPTHECGSGWLSWPLPLPHPWRKGRFSFKAIKNEEGNIIVIANGLLCGSDFSSGQNGEVVVVQLIYNFAVLSAISVCGHNLKSEKVREKKWARAIWWRSLVIKRAYACSSISCVSAGIQYTGLVSSVLFC